jgi:glycosyltransferase involved in cell wall biosynthesis
MPTIGIAIACYKKHLSKLVRLLDSIAVQTLHPTQVVVSTSSCEPTDIPVLPEYPFPVTLVVHRERKNASQNRNIAIQLLTTDIISFIDADDMMMPRRLEAIHTAYMEGARFIVHNYTQDLNQHDNNEQITVQHNKLKIAPSYCLIHEDDYRIMLHHAHSSVDRSILNTIHFREDATYERREDCFFCCDVVKTGIPTAYIPNVLTKYDMDGTIWSQ